MFRTLRVIATAALATAMMAGCGGGDAESSAVLTTTTAATTSSAPTTTEPVVDPAAVSPTSKKPPPRYRIRTDRPHQPLVPNFFEDTSPPEDACEPRCDAYREVRLERTREPWYLLSFTDGEARIAYPRNSCNGAQDEVVVRGERVEVYQYVAIDPIPNDRLGFGCTTEGGSCGGPCEVVTVKTTARTKTEIDRVGVPALPQPCPDVPECVTGIYKFK